MTKAHLFWVIPSQGTPEEMKRLVRDYCEDPDALEFTIRESRFLAKEAQWHAGRSVFTMSVFKIRESDLPVKVGPNGEVESLDLEEDDDLGEPIVFAYYPDLEVCIVQDNHTGPRHPVVREVLRSIGHDAPIHMSPVLRRDMMERLEDARIIRALEFTLTSPQQLQDLRAAGQPVGRALQMLGDLGGVNVSVRVSMGHQRGSLLDGVKGVAQRLVDFGDTELSTLKVSASAGQEAPVEQLDMLNARVSGEFDVNFNGREMDRADCRRKLLNLFEGFRDEIGAQRNMGNHRSE